MLLVQAAPKKGSFILSVTQNIPLESPINTGRILHLEMQKNILSDEIWKEKSSEQLVWIESVVTETRTIYGKNIGRNLRV